MEEHKNTRVISGRTHLEDKERLEDCFLSSLGKEVSRILLLSTTMWCGIGVEKMEANTSQRNTVMRGDLCKPKHGKFELDTREYVFTFKVFGQLN